MNIDFEVYLKKIYPDSKTKFRINLTKNLEVNSMAEKAIKWRKKKKSI